MGSRYRSLDNLTYKSKLENDSFEINMLMNERGELNQKINQI
jgi:hypothetical protein